MTDDALAALFADAAASINRPCTTCGQIPSPYQLVEVRVLGTPTRWLCWDCLPALFGEAEPEGRP